MAICKYRNGIPTHCLKGHALTDENKFIRATGQIGCLTCSREYYTLNKERNLEQMRQRRLRNLEHCREIGRKAGRKFRLRKYNLSEEQFKEMYSKQGGLCILPSCGHPIEVIDHCHATQKTRGLMCDRHNVALGLFSDNPLLLREAASYLENFNAEQLLHAPKFG